MTLGKQGLGVLRNEAQETILKLLVIKDFNMSRPNPIEKQVPVTFMAGTTLRDNFNTLFKEMDRTASQLLRNYMRQAIAEHRIQLGKECIGNGNG